MNGVVLFINPEITMYDNIRPVFRLKSANEEEGFGLNIRRTGSSERDIQENKVVMPRSNRLTAATSSYPSSRLCVGLTWRSFGRGYDLELHRLIQQQRAETPVLGDVIGTASTSHATAYIVFYFAEDRLHATLSLVPLWRWMV